MHEPSVTRQAWSRHSPDLTWDYVVIGSGIGGMAAASLLSRCDRRVLLLEKHVVPGGFTHSFRRHGYEFDVGLHAVGEAVPPTEIGRLLEYLSAGTLRWASVGPVYDEIDFPGGLHIAYPSSPDELRETFAAAFPGERAAIVRYFELLRSARIALRDFLLARTLPWGVAGLVDRWLWHRARQFYGRTTSEVLSEIGASPRLLRLLTAQWGYYGAPPRDSAFAQHAVVIRHYLNGAYYPVGGSRSIAQALLAPVAKAGGWTRTNAAVEEIVVEGERAVGVRLQGGEQIRARRVVSAIGIGATVHRLLPASLQGATWVREVRKLAPSPGHVALYLGLKGDIAAAGAARTNRWFYNTWDIDAERWKLDSAGPLAPPPLVYCSFASLKDPAHDPGPERRHHGEVIALAPWESFAAWSALPSGQRGPAYTQLKERLRERLLAELLARLPGLGPMVDYAEVSTPLSTDSYCNTVAGGMYGLRPTPARFSNRWIRPHTPIEGLYFAGADVGSPGVVGALIGGVLAALAAEPLGTLAQVRHLYR